VAQHHQRVCDGLCVLLPPLQPVCLPAVEERGVTTAAAHAREWVEVCVAVVVGGGAAAYCRGKATERAREDWCESTALG
jgi:hypothetical protein